MFIPYVKVGDCVQSIRDLEGREGVFIAPHEFYVQDVREYGGRKFLLVEDKDNNQLAGVDVTYFKLWSPNK
jgi:hypothetical protein